MIDWLIDWLILSTAVKDTIRDRLWQWLSWLFHPLNNVSWSMTHDTRIPHAHAVRSFSPIVTSCRRHYSSKLTDVSVQVHMTSVPSHGHQQVLSHNITAVFRLPDIYESGYFLPNEYPSRGLWLRNLCRLKLMWSIWAPYVIIWICILLSWTALVRKYILAHTNTCNIDSLSYSLFVTAQLGYWIVLATQIQV